jgi:nitric oxide synthase-interacting protein
MTKHSKNNTASSVFSYAEKQKTEYGTKRQRLGNESMRSFDACALCLQRARDPIACDHGHLFCKECAYADLLNQKKDIKRQKERLEQLKRETEEETQRALEAARERVLRDFEKGQLGLSANLPAIVSTSGAESTKESAWFGLTHFWILQPALPQVARANGNSISTVQPLRRSHGRLKKLHSG